MTGNKPNETAFERQLTNLKNPLGSDADLPFAAMTLAMPHVEQLNDQIHKKLDGRKEAAELFEKYEQIVVRVFQGFIDAKPEEG
mgnify:CR=1 FL=1